MTAAPGWAPDLAAGTGDGRWAAADEHHLHIWSGDHLLRSVDLPGQLGGGPPRFLADGSLLCGRYAVADDAAAPSERVPLTALAEAYDPKADPTRLAVRGLAWTPDGRRGLLDAEYLATRMPGERDPVRPGGMLAAVLVGDGAVTVRELSRGGRPDGVRPAADRWFCAGGRSLRIFDPASGEPAFTVKPARSVTAVATRGEVVVAGTADGEVITVDLSQGEPVSAARHGAVVDAVALSPTGPLAGPLAAGGDREGRLAVWDVVSGETLLEQTLPGKIAGLCFLADDHLVVAVDGAQRQMRHVRLVTAPSGG